MTYYGQRGFPPRNCDDAEAAQTQNTAAKRPTSPTAQPVLAGSAAGREAEKAQTAEAQATQKSVSPTNATIEVSPE